MVPLTKHSPHKHAWGPEFRSPASEVKARQSCVHLLSHHWGDRDKSLRGLTGQPAQPNQQAPGTMRDPVSKPKRNTLDMGLWSPLWLCFPTKSNVSQICGYGNHSDFKKAWEWVEVEKSSFPLCLLYDGDSIMKLSHPSHMTLRVKWQSHLRSSFTVLPGSPIPWCFVPTVSSGKENRRNKGVSWEKLLDLGHGDTSKRVFSAVH